MYFYSGHHGAGQLVNRHSRTEALFRLLALLSRRRRRRRRRPRRLRLGPSSRSWSSSYDSRCILSVPLSLSFLTIYLEKLTIRL